MTDRADVQPHTEPAEDWFGFVVFDDGWTSGIRYDGEMQYDFGHHPNLFAQLVKAGFPLQCEPITGELLADFSVQPTKFPLAYVTAYSDGPAPREHPMGEAGAVVHHWLAEHPDIAQMAADSLTEAGA